MTLDELSKLLEEYENLKYETEVLNKPIVIKCVTIRYKTEDKDEELNVDISLGTIRKIVQGRYQIVCETLQNMGIKL